MLAGSGRLGLLGKAAFDVAWITLPPEGPFPVGLPGPEGGTESVALKPVSAAFDLRFRFLDRLELLLEAAALLRAEGLGAPRDHASELLEALQALRRREAVERARQRRP